MKINEIVVLVIAAPLFAVGLYFIFFHWWLTGRKTRSGSGEAPKTSPAEPDDELDEQMLWDRFPGSAFRFRVMVDMDYTDASALVAKECAVWFLCPDRKHALLAFATEMRNMAVSISGGVGCRILPAIVFLIIGIEPDDIQTTEEYRQLYQSLIDSLVTATPVDDYDEGGVPPAAAKNEEEAA